MTTIEHLIQDSNKGKFGKAIKNAVGVAGIMAMTFGLMGYNTKTLSQINNKLYQDTTARYKNEAFASKDPKDKPIIHQYEV